uniref:EGF-like domain-containing protein n=1 Tax=Schistocephalus solidus TaxID=70667 RepID=A0A183SUS6_SCHSO
LRIAVNVHVVQMLIASVVVVNASKATLATLTVSVIAQTFVDVWYALLTPFVMLVCVSAYLASPATDLANACVSVQCGSNAYCKDGVCICFQGFTGDPKLACQPIYDTSCIGVSCGVNAYCSRGRCVCPDNYTGDPNSYCYSATLNVCDCAGAPPSIAGCSNGKCRCYPGFKARNQEGRCDECRAHGDCAFSARCEYDYDVQLYRCQCEKGFIGDGAIACIPGAEANGTQTAQCRLPCHNFGSCDESSGRCRCRPGFKGNGYTYCDFDCSQCLQEATCAPDLNKCICPPGYTGDGIKFCRVALVQGELFLHVDQYQVFALKMLSVLKLNQLPH